MTERAVAGRGASPSYPQGPTLLSRVPSGSPGLRAGCRLRGGRPCAKATGCSCSERPERLGRSQSRRRSCSAPPTSWRRAGIPPASSGRSTLGADEAVGLDGDFGEPTYVFDPLCGEPLERAVAAAAHGRASSSSGSRPGRRRRCPSAAIRGKQLELYGYIGLRRLRRRPRRALRPARRSRGRGRDPSRARAVGLDEIGAVWGAAGQVRRHALASALGFSSTLSRRPDMTELATPPTEQREGLTRISHWIGGKTVAGTSGRTGPVLQPRSRAAVRRGRPRDDRGGRRGGRSGEGGVPRLARDLAGEARGAALPDPRARPRAP